MVVWAGSEAGLQWGLRDDFGVKRMVHVLGGYIGRPKHPWLSDELSALRLGPWIAPLITVVLSLYFSMRPTWNACLKCSFLGSSQRD